MTGLLLFFACNAFAIPAEEIFDALDQEMKRSMEGLHFEDYPKPYFIGVRLTEENSQVTDFRSGAASYRMEENNHQLIPEVRVGSYTFDQSPDSWRNGETQPITVSSIANLRHYLWSALDETYKQACSLFLSKRAQRSAEGIPDYVTDDFSVQKAVLSVEESPEEPVPPGYEAMLSKVSSKMGSLPETTRDLLKFEDTRQKIYFANTEGSKILQQRRALRVYMSLYGLSLKGLPLHITRSFSAARPGDLPAESKMLEALDAMKADFKELRASKEAHGALAPCILSPDAAAQLFVSFARRLEGERQRDPNEPQTFRNKIGEAVLPSFISLRDDPVLKEHAGVRLMGAYSFDEEGTAAQPVSLIENGVLKGFLLSRRLVKGQLPASNGHARADGSYGAHARAANLIVSSSKMLKPRELREALMKEVHARKTPFGILVEGLEPSRQNSETGSHQTFRGAPAKIKLIYPDGKEVLVHGGEIVGTPLKLMQSILATGDESEAENFLASGISGAVPTSVVSPSLLIAEIELQKGGARPMRLPILGSPLKK